MNKNIGLVLEGGSLRGIFTSGVLDFFLEKGIHFDYVVGVSAGTCNMLGYIAKRKGYIKDRMIVKDKEDRFFGFYQLRKEGKIVNLDKIFFENPEGEEPYDYEDFFNSGVDWEMVVTNVETGQPEYLHEDKSARRLANIAKASCSLPGITRDLKIGRKIYSDGGSGDSIPLKRSIDKGHTKNVVICTRQEGHFPKLSAVLKKYYKTRYKNNPEFLNTLLNRGKMYKEQSAFLNEEVEKGNAFVIRPTIKEVKRMEKDYDKLLAFYKNGYEEAQKAYDALMEFLES